MSSTDKVALGLGAGNSVAIIGSTYYLNNEIKNVKRGLAEVETALKGTIDEVSGHTITLSKVSSLINDVSSIGSGLRVLRKQVSDVIETHRREIMRLNESQKVIWAILERYNLRIDGLDDNKVQREERKSGTNERDGSQASGAQRNETSGTKTNVMSETKGATSTTSKVSQDRLSEMRQKTMVGLTSANKSVEVSTMKKEDLKRDRSLMATYGDDLRHVDNATDSSSEPGQPVKVLHNTTSDNMSLPVTDLGINNHVKPDKTDHVQEDEADEKERMRRCLAEYQESAKGRRQRRGKGTKT